MMLRSLILIVAIAQTPGIPPPEAWVQAERDIVRLKPGAFSSLPAAVRADLEKRMCTIPQADGVDEDGPHNVIRGRFTSAASTDIAVLCSRDGVSTILVFRGGRTTNVAELAPVPDKNFLQTGHPKAIVFSRAILVAKPAEIGVYYKEFGGPKPPPLDHDGIHDAFVSKASIIRYWYGGKWLELTGMD